MYYYKQTIDGNTFYFTSEEVVSYDGATQVTKEEYDAYIEEQRKIAEALKNKRYFYKKGNSYLNLKSPITEEGYEEITEEEFKALTKPPVFTLTEEQQAKIEKKKLIAEKKALLNKYREDVEQVDLFGMERADYEEKKIACRTLVEELRVLERQL